MLEFLSQNKQPLLTIFAIAYVAMSLVTFLLYATDKRRAIKGKWRIPESVLLVFPWILGSLGALMGMFCIRHKTKHWYFVVLNVLAFCAHVALFVWVALL